MFKQLRKIRDQNGVTCSQIASLLGITKATYSKKERGLIIITVQEAHKIADFFNRSIEDIFFPDYISEKDT